MNAWSAAAARPLAAILAGVLTTFTWPPFDLPLLGPPAMALLLLATLGASGRRRFLLGTLGGAVCVGVTFHWVYDTVRVMTGLPSVVAAVVLLLFALWHGLAWGVFAWSAGAVRGLCPRGFPLLAATLWIALEWAFPAVFPIFLGYGWWRVLPAIQIADLTGVLGISFVIVALGAAFADTVLRRRECRSALGVLALAALMPALVYGYGLWRIAVVESAPVRNVARVAMVQPNHTIPEKRSRDFLTRRAMLDRAVALSEPVLARHRGEAPGPRVDALIWPEGSFPTRLPDMQRAAAQLDALGGSFGNEVRDWNTAALQVVSLQRQLGADFIFGSLRRVRGRTRNSAIWLPADGGEAEKYDKLRLVPFGEYLPLSDRFPWLKGRVPGVSDFAAGEGVVRFRVGSLRALPNICYEAIFPGFVRRALEPDDEVLVNLTNDVWFGSSRALDLHLMAQTFRAVENRLPLVRATVTGISAFVSATGEVQGTTGRLEVTSLEGVVTSRRVRSVYRDVGEVFLGGACIVALLWIAVGAKKSGRLGARRRA